jgi:hypothetical protein
VLFYAIDQTLGAFGLVLTRFLLISTALVIPYYTARLLGSRLSVILLLATLVLWKTWNRLEMRPQVFSSVFLALEWWLVLSVHTGRRSPHWLWGMVPLHALWTNLHGGWLQSLAML